MIPSRYLLTFCCKAFDSHRLAFDLKRKPLAQMLDEDPALIEQRKACSQRLELYKNARNEIDSVAWAI